MNLSAKMYDINLNIRYRENLRKTFFTNNPFSKFSNITEERKKEIEVLASLWRNEHPDLSYQDKFYCILEDIRKDRSTGFDRRLAAGDEAFLFLVLTFDSELHLLQISFEENDPKEIKRRSYEHFGFFCDLRILNLERVYNEKFPTIENEFQQKL